ncbi:hypothetical protein JCM8208_001673, partial [Rhodotorula glutinis]
MPSPGPSPPPHPPSLPSTSTTPTPASRAPRPVGPVPAELEPAQLALCRAVSSPVASPPSSPFPPSSLSPAAHSPPVRPVPIHSCDIQQSSPSPINGEQSPSSRHFEPSSPSTSLVHLEPPASPTASTSSRPDDPVTSLGGRRTPFFMVAPHDEWASREREEQDGFEARSAGLGGSGSGGRGGPALRFGVGVGSGGAREQGGANRLQVGAEEGPSGGGRPGRRVEEVGPARDGVEAHPLDLANLVRALVSRVDELENFALDLSHRLHVVETTTPPHMGRSGPPSAFLLPRHHPLAPRFASTMPPSAPPFPSSYPHAFPDGSYHADPHLGRVGPNGDEFTPPASPQVHPHGRPTLSRTSSLLSSSSSAPLGRHGSRERVASFGPLHFSPLGAQSTSSSPQSVGLGPAQTPPLHPGVASLSSMGGRSGGGSMERSASMADLASGGGSEREGVGFSDRAEQAPLHHRSISLGNQFYPRPPLQRHVPLPNYRNLLDTDADIDSESFVRRILAHGDQQCSLFLQQRVRSTTQEKRQELFDAVGRHVLELSKSKF